MNLLPSCSEADRNYGADDLGPTLTKQSYVRCNGQIPSIPKDYALVVQEEKEAKWDIYSLMRFGAKHVTVCMECAGNSRQSLPYEVEGLQWDNRAVSNVCWGGIYLRDILHKIPKDAKEIVFTSFDKEFTRSLPIEVIYERPVMLAWLMNYRNLPIEQGAPLRLIVPGWYGMASVKWLEKIYFTKAFEGKYQTEKYTYKDKEGNKVPVTVSLPKSLITSISTQNPIVIKGKAWSGYKVEKVEVRIDGVWVDAEITASSGDYGWVTWEKKMILKGMHELASRATDAKGITQPDIFSYNFYGYGNNAVQTIHFSV